MSEDDVMDYQKAAVYWTDKAVDSKKMDRDSLSAEIEKFIAAHNTCALATAGMDGFVRCTPIEYNYFAGTFWLLSEGGLKFRGLESNKNVCLAIYDEYKGFGKLGGLQVTGVAEIVEPWTEEYLAVLEFKHIPAESLKKLPTTMNLIKITPTAMDFLNSELKTGGYDSRQHLDMS